ncbi:PREDICTED: putative mediator of RNA polymerase II transcription subunit 24 [Habropoda laboriosa]|uniref:putative mediator of RNA polymerase II transcription subunit 24 n=1 Tax=Habropoda laboriosa TaxID=597456 RepID=UPI00083D4475|nr:PREDICTED: putative mediator of RNA polymerase II transcription subunit 24 [Habropoda laboriosa]
MPGIYVRKASWINGTQRRETSVLTVPGSYWLSHKNNVYKFILRYHRLTRNIKQFNFGRELMKIIRRIIKNQPRQGQQFITSHLLVTYNHTSWTRQDKIFAMTQFKERCVAAFSCAFVLTVKVLYSSETIEQNIEYITTRSAQSLIQEDENSDSGHTFDYTKERRSKKRLVRSFKDDFSQKNNQCYNMQEQVLKSGNRSIQLLDNSAVNNNLKELSENKELVKEVTNNKNTSKLIKNLNASFKLPVASGNNIKLNDSRKKRKTKKLDEHNIEKNVAEYKDNSVSDKSRILDDNSTFDDSLNLPYQYLIEEEIKNTKLKLIKCELEKVSEEVSTVGADEHSDITKIKNLSRFKKKKYALDNVSRSSDITNLVMEGLMFTIRQGQDTVAVIEQKTKLEVDEVLENSEKIETKGGEKCLRNSSLLGLENLITMIELPEESEFTDKNAITQEHTLTNNKIKEQNIPSELKRMQRQSSYNNSPLAGTSFSNSNKDSSIINKRHYSEVYDKYKESTEFAKSKRPKYEEEEEEEDIVPEALQDKIFQSPTVSLKVDKSEEKLRFIPNKDLLMDDIESEELVKFRTIKNEHSFHFSKNLQPRTYSKNDSSNDNLVMKSGEMSMNSIVNKTQQLHDNTVDKSSKKCKSNVPIVISNQIITTDQIPLPLQKILRNKLSMKRIFSNNNNEINEDNIEICKAQSYQIKDNISNVQLEHQSSDNNTLTNTQCLKQHHKSEHDNKGTYNESTSSATSRIELKDTNVSEKNINLKKEESQEENTCTVKVEGLLPNKIKDITQKFYQDLSQLQQKKNFINQKYFKSKRKSLNKLNDASNDQIKIQMVKLFQDITRGAKVVIRRMSTNIYS